MMTAKSVGDRKVSIRQVAWFAALGTGLGIVCLVAHGPVLTAGAPLNVLDAE
jgi:hypothetical protein